jgi:hypothetical protein
MRLSIPRAASVLSLSLSLLAHPSAAQTSMDDAPTVGITVGGGLGTTSFGGRTRHDFALIMYSRTWTLARPNWAETERRGRWELGLEVSGGAQVFPHNRDFTSASPMVRYRWRANDRWISYAEAGIGASYTNIREPDLSTRFQFIDQFGGGVLRHITRETKLNVGMRWVHISNGGIASPNHGVNTLMLRLGAVWSIPEAR